MADQTELDPKKLSTPEYLEAMDAAMADGGMLREADPSVFARLVKRTSGDQLKALDESDLRQPVLTLIFGRMGEAFRGDKLSATRTSLVRWEVTGAETTVFETSLQRSGCTVSEGESGEEPRTTLTLSFTEFLKLASGNGNPTMMFMTRKLKAGGDVGFATGLTNLFDLPKP